MINPMLLADFYKVGHGAQYPADVTQVWSNWTPRTSRVEGQTSVVHFGLQYFIKDYLMRRFDQGFFGRPLAQVLDEYRDVVRTCLGVPEPKTDHVDGHYEHDAGGVLAPQLLRDHAFDGALEGVHVGHDGTAVPRNLH